jgi:hypothetical protein
MFLTLINNIFLLSITPCLHIINMYNRDKFVILVLVKPVLVKPVLVKPVLVKPVLVKPVLVKPVLVKLYLVKLCLVKLFILASYNPYHTRMFEQI